MDTKVSQPLVDLDNAMRLANFPMLILALRKCLGDLSSEQRIALILSS